MFLFDFPCTRPRSYRHPGAAPAAVALVPEVVLWRYHTNWTGSGSDERLTHVRTPADGRWLDRDHSLRHALARSAQYDRLP